MNGPYHQLTVSHLVTLLVTSDLPLDLPIFVRRPNGKYIRASRVNAELAPGVGHAIIIYLGEDV